jgi:signal transduction histidine kinase
VSPIEVLAHTHVVALPAVAVAAIAVWVTRRTRPPAYLAATFTVLATVVVLARVPPTEGISLIPILGLSTSAWLLTAFAWSFDGPLPPTLRAAALAIPGVVTWELLASPLESTGAVARTAFLVTFLTVWTAFAGAACGRLWTMGADQRVVRARARTMAVGVAALNLAVVLAALPENAATWWSALVSMLAVVAALLFFVSFLAPPSVRHWWRRGATDPWERMQHGLISASTPTEVAAVTAPAAAHLSGGSVTIVTRAGEVLAADARELGRHLAAGEPLGDHQQVIAVNGSFLIVGLSPHSPAFGRPELAIIEGLARQLELALDRTELTEAHQDALAEARASRRDVEVLLAGLAHDLRSPSVAITGYLSLLRDVDDPHERAQMLDALEESASYISSLVDSIAELAAVGRDQIDVEPVDLEPLVHQVARRLAVQHPRVTVIVDTGLPVLLLNPAGAEQILDNLLRNAAIHGGRDDVQITVSSRFEPDGSATIAVSDDGVGIAEREREHVFQMFHRGRDTLRGSGLGLSIARRIIGSVGGTLRLAESSPTGGASFLLRVPAETVIQGERDDLDGAG